VWRLNDNSILGNRVAGHGRAHSTFGNTVPLVLQLTEETRRLDHSRLQRHRARERRFRDITLTQHESGQPLPEPQRSVLRRECNCLRVGLERLVCFSSNRIGWASPLCLTDGRR
jgi:hypothetical protein